MSGCKSGEGIMLAQMNKLNWAGLGAGETSLGVFCYISQTNSYGPHMGSVHTKETSMQGAFSTSEGPKVIYKIMIALENYSKRTN